MMAASTVLDQYELGAQAAAPGAPGPAPSDRRNAGNCLCIPKTHPGVIPRRNRLGWQDDRAVLLRFGRGALTADTGIVLTAVVGQMAARRSDF